MLGPSIWLLNMCQLVRAVQKTAVNAASRGYMLCPNVLQSLFGECVNNLTHAYAYTQRVDYSARNGLSVVELFEVSLRFCGVQIPRVKLTARSVPGRYAEDDGVRAIP